jgi:hypothetical protein
MLWQGVQAVVAVGLIAPAIHAAEVYTQVTDFLDKLKPGVYFEPCNNVPSMTFVEEVILTGNGYIVKAKAPAGFFQPAGIISANEMKDQITLEIVQGDVTAIGGFFFGTDASFKPVKSLISITLSDGTQESFTTSTGQDFRGFIFAAPITSLKFDADDSAKAAWATLDNLYIGEALPDDCYADCDDSGSLTIDDFICFQTLFVIGDSFADCDSSGQLTIDDFICFQTFFVLAC